MNQITDLLNENCVHYNGKEITVIFDNNNNPWFKAKEIAEILGYSKSKDAINKHVRETYKTSYFELRQGSRDSRPPLNMQPHAIFISEAGLYSLIMSSKMELAIQFQDWIFQEVLPSVRKYGEYRLESKIKELKDSNKLLSIQNESLTLAVDYWKGESVTPTQNRDKHHQFVLIKKNHPWEYPYYVIRAQKQKVDLRIKELLEDYPELEILLRFCDGNSINLYNRMKEEFDYILWQGNHFSVCLDEPRLIKEIMRLHLNEEDDY